MKWMKIRWFDDLEFKFDRRISMFNSLFIFDYDENMYENIFRMNL